jgi:HEAT repeat protein
LLSAFQHDSEIGVRKMAVNALWLLGDPVVLEPIIAALLDREEHPSLRSDCADALGQMAECWSLDEQGKKAALEALLAVLQDENTEVRCFAAFALGLLRDPAAIPALQHVVATDEGTDPRWGPVRDEAREAITLIEGRADNDAPERD